MSGGKRTLSEERLEAYLSEHGYQFAHEPDLDGSVKRPDYLVTAPSGAEAVVEVKEFTSSRIESRLVPGQAFSLGPKEVYGTIRNAVDRAATQLRPYRDRGWPLVVALANPYGVWVHLDFEHTLEALYGNPGYSIPIDPTTGGAAGEGSPFLGRDGSLSAKHAYISAVLIVHERDRRADWIQAKMREFDGDLDAYSEYVGEAEARGEVPRGPQRYITAIHTITAATGETQPLPDEFFGGPDDVAWAYNRTAGTYDLIRGEVDEPG